MSGNSDLLGAVLLVRHGDRRGFYQDPDTYTASDTSLTPLGAIEELAVGSILRARYRNASSPNYIQGLSTDLFDHDQVSFRADAADEGFVIYESAIALSQALWPATTSFNTTLNNGSTISFTSAPQYIPITSVGLDDVSLEGFTDCGPFASATEAFYNSSEFAAMAAKAAPFLDQLPSLLDGRLVTLVNMFNIFDYMNVNSIHNQSFAQTLPPTFLEQARALASWHEYGVFTSATLNGIGNIAGQAILGPIMSDLNSISNASDPLKLSIQQISYKPFLSLMNMTGVAAANPQLQTIVDYASVVALELHQSSTAGGSPVLRFVFANATDMFAQGFSQNISETMNFTTYSMFGNDGDTTLEEFSARLGPVAINSTAQWCAACSNTQDRGCAALAEASASAVHALQLSTGGGVTKVQAGVIGAMLSLVFAGCVVALLLFLGVLSRGIGNKRHRQTGVVRRDRDTWVRTDSVRRTDNGTADSEGFDMPSLEKS